jgi:signal transduction histidine kinase/CheY-like chemotaxis protein/ABC-type sugar transport system substrate-binding protein
MVALPRDPDLTIGVLTGWQYYWTATPLNYLDPLFHGMCFAAQRLGCRLLIGCGIGASATPDDPLRPAWPFPLPEADFVPIGPWNTDGLVVVNPLHIPALSRDVQTLRAAGHPLQFVGAGERGPTISADNAGGIFAAMEHLVAHGQRRIAFIAGSPDDLDGDSGDRLRAYQAALHRHGLPTDPRLVAYGRHVSIGGYAAMQQILAGGAPFTAVLASNDESAMGAIDALREAGRRIPHDVAVIGFDDRPESAVQTPGLSSVRVPLFRMGYQAVALLVETIRNGAAPTEPVRVPTQLIARESCGCGRSYGAVARVAGLADEQGRAPGVGCDGLVQGMSAALLAQVQDLPPAAAQAACRRLLDALDHSYAEDDPSRFFGELDELLDDPAYAQENAHLWQTVISVLHQSREEFPLGAADLLDGARVAISAHVQRRHRRYVVNEQWLMNRMGVLTAQLQLALNESDVFAILAHHLPAIGITHGWVALFAPDDPVDALARCSVRSLTDPDAPVIQCRSRDFLEHIGIGEGTEHTEHTEEAEGATFAPAHATHPSPSHPPTHCTDAACCVPATLSPRIIPPFHARPSAPAHALPRSLTPSTPSSLALLPLVNARGQVGFVAFDSEHLERYGAIVQQMAAALLTAQLYHEAMEGRRLAEEADRLKSRFLSTVSHELRTPLNVIVGLSRLLVQAQEQQALELPEPYRDDLERIYANAQHLGGLIGDVLDLASSDAGQLRLANEYVDLSATLRMVAETGARFAADKGLDWSADLPAAGPWVWGDRTRLRQVALNLINNAVKFTSQGSVRLSIEVSAATARVHVRDTGLGIPPEDQALIFSEFRRSDRSMNRGYTGLGLGLAICKRLIELHGGTIGLYSSGQEGAGSTFYFTLPLVAPPPAVLPGASPTGDRVVVLTDQAASGQRLVAYLGERGFHVELTLTAATPDWPIRLAAAAPSAIVLDMHSAPEPGWAILKTIKSHPLTRHVPVLFYTLTEDRGAVLELDYLTKPVDLAALTQALEQHTSGTGSASDAPTVLVVDDDPGALDLHTRIVQGHWPAARVLQAAGGRAALAILGQTRVGLVLLDLMMPEIDGFDVLERMREEETTRDIPVIVLTGQVLNQAEIDRLDQGVAAVMSKGLFSSAETLAHLDAALERRRKLSNEAQRLVRRAMAYIHEHYAEPISRADLARHVTMAEDYLTTCFHKEVGMTPIAYLNRYRVNQARLILKQSAANITEIATAVGFADSGYFSRIFRREVGLAPEAYRRASHSHS